MEKYKVLFIGNHAVSASRLEEDTEVYVKINQENDGKFVEWYIVYGEDEQDAMALANEVVGEYWLRVLEP